MKLTVELVPGTSWCKNLRSELSSEDWDDLRQACYRKASYLCEVCGGRGPDHPVECHEVWQYDDKKHIQKLMGLIALCPACHEVKHFGRASVTGHGKRALKHLMKVNEMTKEESADYLTEAFDLCVERSKHKWALDLSWLKGRINGKS